MDERGRVALNDFIMKAKILLILLVWAFVALAKTNPAAEFRTIGKVNYDVSQPPFIAVTIPAGAALDNAAAIHFDGTIKPTRVSFLLPEINNHTKNVRVFIQNFQYTPTLFKDGQLRIVEPITQMTVHYKTFQGLVTKSNLELRVFPLSHP